MGGAEGEGGEGEGGEGVRWVSGFLLKRRECYPYGWSFMHHPSIVLHSNPFSRELRLSIEHGHLMYRKKFHVSNPLEILLDWTGRTERNGLDWTGGDGIGGTIYEQYMIHITHLLHVRHVACQHVI